MKRLFALEFARLSKQTSAMVIAIIIFVLGGFNVLLAGLTAFEINEGEIQYFFTARSILESSFQLGQIQILLIGVVTSLFISTDISQGTIRNKIIAGYSKFEIYLVQMVMSAFITVSGLVLFHFLPSAFSWLITFPTSVDDGGTFANFMIHMSFGYFLIIVGVLLTTWLALKSKTTASAIIFTLLVFVLGPTLTTIITSIIEVVTLANIDLSENFEYFLEVQASLESAFDWIYFYQLNRLANLGSLFDLIAPSRLNFLDPDNFGFILKTIGSNMVLLFLIVYLGGRNFAKSDLR
jgi:hypothetical protein